MSTWEKFLIVVLYLGSFGGVLAVIRLVLPVWVAFLVALPIHTYLFNKVGKWWLGPSFSMRAFLLRELPDEPEKADDQPGSRT